MNFVFTLPTTNQQLEISKSAASELYDDILSVSPSFSTRYNVRQARRINKRDKFAEKGGDEGLNQNG